MRKLTNNHTSGCGWKLQGWMEGMTSASTAATSRDGYSMKNLNVASAAL
jgi:hypothetical protein